jgi:regulator-associated protein of mTOR
VSSVADENIFKFLFLYPSGSQDQRIKVFNQNGDELSLIRYHDGFLGQRIGPVSALNFHPYHILLAAGATDSLVSIYAGETFKNTGNN